MPNPWLNEFWRFLSLIILAIVLGLMLDQILLMLLLASWFYLAWNLYYLYRLDKWVVQRQTKSPPEGKGVWGEVFYSIYRLQRRNRKRKKKLAAMLARFQESTSAMPDATLVLNAENEIEWFNKAAISLLGLNKVVDIGLRVENLVRTPVFVTYLKRADFQRPLEIFSPEDKNIRISINIVPYGKSQKLVIVRDITRLYQLERVRRDFVANVSHELKTPLTVVNGYLENMIDSEFDSPDQWNKILLQMYQQSIRMQHIVDDLLMLSRLESNDDDGDSRDPVAVPALIAALTEEIQPLIREKHQTVNLDCNFSLWLLGNEKEIYSSFSNIVINAIKYTPEQGEIGIRWFLQDDQPCFEVSDTGIGIAPQHIPRLTERFYRVDTGRSRQEGGTGLGLAIVKHVLLRHNAVLKVTSQVNQGSVFRCFFPADRALVKESSQVQGL